MPEAPRLAVVAPCLNEEACVPLFVDAVREVLLATGYAFEILLVDDGSTDGTWAQIQRASAEDPRVRGVRLSRNFGHDAAITAGMDYARGDAVIVMDADLQHPPAVLTDMLARWRAGADVVLGVRRHTADASALKQWSSKCYYGLLNGLSGIHLEPGAPDFRLLDRVAVEAFRQCPERVRMVRGLVTWLGFRVDTVPFDAPSRAAGESKFTPLRMARKGLDGMLAFSAFPLRLVSLVGLLVVAGALAYLAYVLYARFTNPATVPGWTSTIAAVLLLGGMQLLSIGVLGEYLSRTYEEVKGRPVYVVREQLGEGATPASRRAVPPPAHGPG